MRCAFAEPLCCCGQSLTVHVQLVGCAVSVQVPMDQPKVMLKLLSQFVNGRDMSSLTTGRAAAPPPPRGRITWRRPRGTA